MTETDTPTAVPMADPISAVPIPSASREGPKRLSSCGD